MSGGGGGSYGGGDGSDSFDCETFVRKEALTDPVVAVLAALKKDDVCDVVLEHDAGPTRILVKAPIVENGQTILKLAGVLFFTGFLRLIACIREGHTYIAVVRDVQRGWCEVEVRPRAPRT